MPVILHNAYAHSDHRVMHAHFPFGVLCGDYTLLGLLVTALSYYAR